MTTVRRTAALAVRLARQHLDARVEDAATAAYVGLQDTPPGSAGQSLAARMVDASPSDLDSLVIVPSLRGAPLAVAREDLAVFTAGVAPPDDKAAAVLIGNAAKALPDGVGSLEALDRVSDAVGDALSDGPLERDDFHQALRDRLPKDLLWWCKGCQSHHVHPSLWRATGIRGVLAIGGRAGGRTAIFEAPPRAAKVDDPAGELARRFLRAYGPATHSLLAAWAGIAPAHAKELWERAGELAEVKLEGKKAFVLADDVDVWASPPEVEGVRLLPGYDGFLAARDRELLQPDEGLRKQQWRPLGNPGAVLRDGKLSGTWRAAKKGKKLTVTVDWFTSRPPKRALSEEAATLAVWRDVDDVSVVVS